MRNSRQLSVAAALNFYFRYAAWCVSESKNKRRPFLAALFRIVTGKAV